MITLNCPDCGEKYELDDDMAGKKAACSCGAVLFIPKTVDSPEGKKVCPNCQTFVEEESVLCVSCGYNFETGGRMRPAESRVEVEEDPKFILLRKLWKPALFLFIILIIGVIVYNSFFVKHYGISSTNPLGTLYAIELHLNDSGYETSEPDKELEIPEIFGDGVKKLEWKDVKLEKQSSGMFSEKVFAIVSSENKILAIGANFKGGVKAIPGDTGSRTGRFMSSLWKDAGLKFPPDYKPETEGEGKWASTYYKSETSSNDVRAEWIEYPSDISLIPSSHTMLITYSRFPDISYKKIQVRKLEEYDIDEFKKKLQDKFKKENKTD